MGFTEHILYRFYFAFNCEINLEWLILILDMTI